MPTDKRAAEKPTIRAIRDPQMNWLKMSRPCRSVPQMYWWPDGYVPGGSGARDFAVEEITESQPCPVPIQTLGMLSWLPTCVVQIDGAASNGPSKSLRQSRPPTSDRLYRVPWSSDGSAVPFGSTPTPKMIRCATARTGGAVKRKPRSCKTLSTNRHLTVPALRVPTASRAIEYRIPELEVT